MKRLLAVAVLLVGLDQLTKQIISHVFELNQSHPIINNVFHLTYIKNSGAAFGIFQGHRWLLMGVSFLAIIAIVAYIMMHNPRSLTERTAWTLVLSGAAGNMIDRIFLGAVVDFFDFQLINFAIFNVADCYITIGVALLVVFTLIYGRAEV